MIKDSPIPWVFTIGIEQVEEAKEKTAIVESNKNTTYSYMQAAQSYYNTAVNYVSQTLEQKNLASQYQLDSYNDMIRSQTESFNSDSYSKLSQEYSSKSWDYMTASSDSVEVSKSWAIEEEEQNSKYWIDIAKYWSNNAIDSSKFWYETGVQYINATLNILAEAEKYTTYKVPRFELDLDELVLYHVNEDDTPNNAFSIVDGVLYHEYVA